MTDELAVGVDEAARRLGVARTYLYEAIGSGALRSFKLGRRRLIAVSELSRYVERATSVQNAKPVPPKVRAVR